MSPAILLGPDFFGAGNIGDDLMMAGFLEALSAPEEWRLVCPCSHDRGSQVLRFAHVHWPDGNDPAVVAQALAACDAWIGVGGTPFQMSSGPWLLDRLLGLSEVLEARRRRLLFIGAGAEAEVESAADKVRTLLRRTALVITRDAGSARILRTIARDVEPPLRIESGEDLANIALERLFHGQSAQPRPVDLALNYFEERPRLDNLVALRGFLAARHEAGSVLAVFANDVRERFDARFHKRLTWPFRRPWLPLVRPVYATASLEELVAPMRRFDVVMSSRLHGLLTAAWAGCRPVALARSSKIERIANDLAIPFVPAPFTRAALEAALEKAHGLERSDLEARAAHARAMVWQVPRLLQEA